MGACHQDVSIDYFHGFKQAVTVPETTVIGSNDRRTLFDQLAIIVEKICHTGKKIDPDQLKFQY